MASGLSACIRRTLEGQKSTAPGRLIFPYICRLSLIEFIFRCCVRREGACQGSALPGGKAEWERKP